jgi:hypothetical protein
MVIKVRIHYFGAQSIILISELCILFGQFKAGVRLLEPV